MDTNVLRKLRDVVFTGLAIIVPIVLTLYLIWVTIDLFGRMLRPFVQALEFVGIIEFFRRRRLLQFLIEMNLYSDVIGVLSEMIAVALFFGVVVLIGALARYRYGESIIGSFDYVIASVPGVGTVYQSLRRVGKIVLTETSDEFHAVKLVEFLSEETYVIAFKTSEPPRTIETATGHPAMETLFIPMAPNPVTGGFLTYVPKDRVIDVDMPINDAVQAILTSGINHDQDGAPRPETERP